MDNTEMDKLTEVATDLKWIKATLSNDTVWKQSVEQHLAVLSSCVQTNTIFRKVSTWVLGIIFIAVVALVVKVLFGVTI